MRELLELIVRSLVDRPDEVRVEEVERGDSTVLELRVAPGDLGKVIGKQGRTAKSLRTVLDAAGERHGRRIALEIME